MHIYLCSIFTLVFFSVDLLTRTGLSYFTREAVGGIMLIVYSVNLHVLLVEGVASYLRSTVTMETISRDVKPLMHVAALMDMEEVGSYGVVWNGWKDARDTLRRWREENSRKSDLVLELGQPLLQSYVSALGNEGERVITWIRVQFGNNCTSDSEYNYSQIVQESI